MPIHEEFGPTIVRGKYGQPFVLGRTGDSLRLPDSDPVPAGSGLGAKVGPSQEA